MQRHFTFTRLALAAATLAASGSATLVFAAQSPENGALAISKTPISLMQAIAAAEQHVGGKASQAELQVTKSGYVFDVEVVKDNEVFDVEIDAKDAHVIASVLDKNDHEDKHDREDGHDKRD